MRLIDADALIKKLAEIGSKLAFNDRSVFLAVSMLIANPSEIPTVDAMQIVRCKECKHYIHSPRDTIGNCDRNAISGIRFIVDEKWFCADGMRREE